MTHTIETKTPTGVTINVTVPYGDIEPTLPKATEAISAATEFEGFRKGKAPFDVVKQRVGEFKILEEAARIYIEEHFTEIIGRIEQEEYQEKSFEPIGEPRVAITKLAPGENVEYQISLALLPAVQLPDYAAIAKRVRSLQPVPEVKAEELASAIAAVSRASSPLK